MSTRREDLPSPGSAAAWTEAHDLPAAAERPPDRYQPGGELGRGGMGVVRAATDRWLDREIAVKRPLAHDRLDRVMREARLAGRLLHPSIPPVYDVGEDEQGPYYTMPVLHGRTLHAALADPPPLRAIVEALRRAAEALGHAHRRGVVHRDVKPPNLLLGEDGEVWVVDWGVAHDPTLPAPGAAGTPGYAAPEQLDGAAPHPAADVYGLGRCLLDALPPSPPPELQAIARRCVDPDPARRYPDGAVLADELDRWLLGEQVRAHDYTAREVVWRAVRRWRAPLAVAGAALAVLAAGSLVARRQQQQADAATRVAVAAALAQNAAARLDHLSWPEAATLAAHALQHADDPRARGVLLATAAVVPPTHSALPSPCPRPRLLSDASRLCGASRLAPDGPTPTRLDLPDGAEVIAAQALGDAVLVKHTPNNLRLVRDGVTRWYSPNVRGSVWVGTGDALVAAIGRTVWTFADDTAVPADLPCDPEALYAHAGEVWIACRGAHGGPVGGPLLELPASPSALTWRGGPVFGLYDGTIRWPDGHTTRSPVGPPVSIVPLGDTLAVLGEGGRACVVRDELVLSCLPGLMVSIAAHGERTLDALGTDGHLTRWTLPTSLPPPRFDRTSQGGLSGLDRSPDGAQLVASSATGEVVVWDTSDGTAEIVVPSAGTTARRAVFLDAHTLLIPQVTGTSLVPWPTGEATPWSTAPARRLQRVGDEALLISWGDTVAHGGPVAQTTRIPGGLTAATTTPPLWVSDTSGNVGPLVGDGLAPTANLQPPPFRMVWLADQLATITGTTLRLYDQDGTLRAAWPAPTELTALLATADHLFVGDKRGQVTVLNNDLQTVATLGAHRRRVSDLTVHGDEVITASWDGTALRLNVRALTTPGQTVVAEVHAAWGLSLDDALVVPPPVADRAL